MDNEKFQNKYRIKSARAVWHDYADGTYFVTVCTKNREHFFGEFDTVETGHVETGHVETGRVETGHVETGHVETGRAPSLQMTKIGQFLYDNLQNVTVHYPYVEMLLFVVMPNHWHAIMSIDGNKTPYTRRHFVGTGRVETGRAPSKMQQIDSFKNWLSVAIGGIKSAVTKFAHDNKIDFTWQTRFHDHIIRNQEEMNYIANYIENNPAKWDVDCFNGNNSTSLNKY